MTLAMKRLKNIGWLALVFLVAIMLYPLSLNVAALHSDLVRVDQQILNTKREISFLQAELRTRASLAQLEEWNKLLYDYKPPTAAQFLDGESALADLGGKSPTIKPVLVSVDGADDVAPSGVIGSPFAKLASVDKDTLDQAASSNKADSTEAKKSKAQGGDSNSITSRTENMADMDKKLLSDDLLRDVERTAKREGRAQ